MTDQKTHEPKCPSCSIIGIRYIVQSNSEKKSRAGDPWFNIVHCSECGHVYGVFNKVSLPPTSSIL